MAKKKRSRRRFTDEFKAETVKLVKQSDRTMSDIAMELGISSKSVGEWVRFAADSEESISEDDRAELKRLRKENSELRMEKEILRKATLGSTSQRNTFVEAFCG
jgi:transposase